MFDAEIQQAVDDYLEMERKAKAWDELLRMAERDWPPLVDTMRSFVSSSTLPSKPAEKA